MTPDGRFPWVLVVVPILLVGFDVGYKWGFYKEPPSDSVADVALAGLTFSAVHLLTKLMNQAPSSTQVAMPVMAMFMLFLQFLVWPACLLWSKWLKDNPTRRGWLIFSYLVGGSWFAYSTGRILSLAP